MCCFWGNHFQDEITSSWSLIGIILVVPQFSGTVFPIVTVAQGRPAVTHLPGCVDCLTILYITSTFPRFQTHFSHHYSGNQSFSRPRSASRSAPIPCALNLSAPLSFSPFRLIHVIILVPTSTSSPTASSLPPSAWALWGALSYFFIIGLRSAA